MCVCVLSCRGWGGFEGWWFEGWGARRWGPEPRKGGPEGLGARRVGGPEISRFFFTLPPQNSFFSSLSGGPFVEFWCFRRPGRSNVHVWGSRVVVRSPGGPEGAGPERERKRTGAVQRRGGPAEGGGGERGPLKTPTKNLEDTHQQF